jgi:hypothetical protein
MMFRFPRTRFSAGQLRVQLDHSTSELLETITALDGGEGMMRVAEEIVDTIHSLETGLRIMQEQHGVNIADVCRYVECKNRVRGYYD